MEKSIPKKLPGFINHLVRYEYKGREVFGMLQGKYYDEYLVTLHDTSLLPQGEKAVWIQEVQIKERY